MFNLETKHPRGASQSRNTPAIIKGNIFVLRYNIVTVFGLVKTNKPYSGKSVVQKS